MNTIAHFRAVIFDVDGTLFDTLPSLSAACNSVLAKADLHEVAMPLLRDALNEGLRQMFRAALALQTRRVDPGMASQLEGEFLEHYKHSWLPAAPLYANALDTLQALTVLGVKLGICTNRDRASTEVLLTKASIAELFETIVGMGDAPRPKPAAEPLLMVLERMGIPASDALFVGDSYIDASCAEQSHVKFAAHRNGYGGNLGDHFPGVLSFSEFEQVVAWARDGLASNMDSRHA